VLSFQLYYTSFNRILQHQIDHFFKNYNQYNKKVQIAEAICT